MATGTVKWFNETKAAVGRDEAETLGLRHR